MSENTTDKKSRINIKHLIIISVTLVLACIMIVLAGQWALRSLDEFTPSEMGEITDELNRTKHFVSDWYLEISNSDTGDCSVYLNEIRFGNNEYALTFAAGRLRAVYPRGERFFKFEYISKAEFFEVDGKVRCRLYYGRTGEYTFTV